jgi:hypothetical protein
VVKEDYLKPIVVGLANRAAAGAAGGAITQVLTGGNNINIPAESTLTFKLDQPLTLNP